jgi:Putative transposase/Transposase zinc-binding domain
VSEPAFAHHPSHHTTARPDGYVRRKPEETVLHQTISAHWPAFRERMEDNGGLPKFVVTEFEEYLKCGLLDKGCVLLECRSCGHSQLVAFSCKRRAWCPSCVARRMVDTGVHLEQHVLPEAPVRHWICSLPWGFRALLGYDRVLCAEVLRAVIAELSRSLKWRAKSLLGLQSVSQVLTGAVAAVQRVDSALRLNVHFHILYLDGVYVRGCATDDGSPLSFHPLPTPTRDETADITRRIADRVELTLKKHGRSLEPEFADAAPTELQLEHPALAACYDAAAMGVAVSGERAGQPTLRVVSGNAQASTAVDLPDEPVAEVRGINLYGRQWVHGRDRPQLERLCRYITRPPIAQDRLSQRPDGTLFLEFKKAWKDGTCGLVLQPEELLVRLCAAVPPPRFHMLRYFGVLSSHSAYRARVVPEGSEDTTAHRPPPAAGDQLDLLSEQDDAPPKPTRRRWAWLLAHIFLADLEHCPKCRGPMRWTTVAKTEAAALRLMAQLGLAPQPPPPRQHTPLGQLLLPFTN